jgi:uncharacterized protein
MKIIFDVNVWISFAIGKRLSVLKDVLANSKVLVYRNNELVKEFIETSQKPTLQKYLTIERITETIELIESLTIQVENSTVIPVSRDPKDDYLLALSRRVRANYLVTGDKDLLVIGQYGQTRILNFSAFLELLNLA